MFFDVIHHATEGLSRLAPALLKGWDPPSKQIISWYSKRPNLWPLALAFTLDLNAILVGLAFIVLRGDGLAHETGDENVGGWHPFLPVTTFRTSSRFKDLMSQKSRCVSGKFSRIHVLGADWGAMKNDMDIYHVRIELYR